VIKRKVDFRNDSGLRLEGMLERPDRSEQMAGIVLCQAGTGTSEAFLPEVSKWLVEHRYAVLRFDYQGVGRSEGKKCELMPVAQVEDIQKAITFMQQQEEVEADRIGLWGPSSGAANVSYTAGVDPRVKCMVSVSGIGDMGRWFKAMRRYWEWKEFLKRLEEDKKQYELTGESKRVLTSEIVLPVSSSGMDTLPFPKNPAAQKNQLTLASARAMLKFKPEMVVQHIAPRAAMWIYTIEDTVIPIEESQSMYQKADEPKKLVALEGYKHYELYQGKGFESVMTHSTEWFDAHL
jgi:alpha-beta hydrolase superfamily lysophospholipase